MGDTLYGDLFKLYIEDAINKGKILKILNHNNQTITIKAEDIWAHIPKDNLIVDSISNHSGFLVMNIVYRLCWVEAI